MNIKISVVRMPSHFEQGIPIFSFGSLYRFWMSCGAILDTAGSHKRGGGKEKSNSSALDYEKMRTHGFLEGCDRKNATC